MVEASPLIAASVTRGGKLALGRGSFLVCVDTGFTGDVALPSKVLKRLRLRYVGPTDYQLANGSITVMDQWLGWVIAGDYEYETLFIEGDWLLGMEFITDTCRSLRIDCRTRQVRLTLRP